MTDPITGAYGTGENNTDKGGEMSLWKFKIGDRVKREIDIYNRMEGFKFGIITLRYSRPEDQYGDITLGPYKELYDVLWDDGKAERGFLPHGLDIDTRQGLR